MGKPKNGRQVYFREAYLWEKIAKAAAEDNRSVNNYIETVITNHLNSLKK